MKFTVVVPLYNKGYSIERCINSVLAQCSHLDQVIIVNDGSTDNSLELVLALYHDEITAGKIVVVDQENQGVSAARNRGVVESLNEYVCLLDADDEWLPGFLQAMGRLIEDFPGADLYSLAHLIKKPGCELTKPKHGLADGFRGYVLDFFKSSAKGSVAKSSKICVRKEALLSIGGFPVGVVAGEDLYVWIRMALNGKVACDMKHLSVVYQELDSSRGARRVSVPYPLVYFSKNKPPKIVSLHRYLFSIFYKHFLSSLVNKKFKESLLRLYYYLRIYL